MNEIMNISSWLKKSAEIFPYKRAVVVPNSRDAKGRVLYSHMTFNQLDMASDNLAFAFEENGITRGTRTILMVPPGLDFFTIIFALFKVGAVPVVVDPGMGVKRMLSCFEQGKPTAFIGIEKAHLLRVLKPWCFKTVTTCITVGKRILWGGLSLDKLLAHETDTPFPPVPTAPHETAAILFTTGSTGPAKGVIYSHANFDAQLRQIRDHFHIGLDEIDLPTFPLFALFDPALGMTAVIPDMDPTKPAQVNPEKIIEAIENQGVTNMFASPALLNRVGKFGKEMGVKLPSLKRVVSAGAPVTPANIEQFSTMLGPETEIHTPYGATEAVPIISIGSNEILSETRHLSEQGFGMCVGYPIGDTAIEIITITDDPIDQWHDDLKIPANEVGEIVVKAPLVTSGYFNNPGADLLAKIEDGEGGVWHRMGDLAWKDSKGRIWFCGRKSHRVTTGKGPLFSIPVEAVFNNHPQVFRSALTGVGPRDMQTAVMCIEAEPDVANTQKLLEELYAMADKHPLADAIEYIFIHPAFPVDIRHNSKIFREKLALWADKKVKT